MDIKFYILGFLDMARETSPDTAKALYAQAYGAFRWELTQGYDGELSHWWADSIEPEFLKLFRN